MASRFRVFAEDESRESSPLYSALALQVIEDPELLKIADLAPSTQPISNLFIGSIQYLLEQENRAFSAGENPVSAYARLRDVVFRRRAELEQLLTTRIVQTNEVRRSVFLYPSFLRIAREFPGRKFALIEIGPSAGINLLFDQFEYRFGGSPFGNVGAEVQLTTELRGGRVPPSEPSGNLVVRRIGLDLNPLDVNAEEDVRWLEAMIWPEHENRRILLKKAISMRRMARVEMVAGDGSVLLPEFVNQIPEDVVVLVFHTYVANQMPSEAKSRLLAAVEELGRRRDLAHLYNCIHPHLHASIWRSGELMEVPLAKTEPHGRWVEWLD